MKLKLLTTKEMQTKKPAELEAYATEMHKTRVDLLEQLQTGKEKSTHQLKLIKRSIATAKTIAKQQPTEVAAKKEKK